MPLRPLLLALALLALGATPAQAGSATDSTEAGRIIARVLDAYGGRAKLETVKAYRIEGKLTAVRRGNITVSTSRDLARPNLLRVEIHYPEVPEIRVLNGNRGWRTDDEGEYAEASGPFLDAMVLQAMRANVPWILAEAADKARIIEPLESGGTRLIGLEFPLSAILTFRAYVHPRTWHVEMSQGLLEHGGMTTHFETYYEDFRSVRGVLFAFREENYASGAHTGWTLVERVQLNPTFPPGNFKPVPAKQHKQRIEG